MFRVHAPRATPVIGGGPIGQVRQLHAPPLFRRGQSLFFALPFLRTSLFYRSGKSLFDIVNPPPM